MGAVSAVTKENFAKERVGLLGGGEPYGGEALGFAAVMREGHCSDEKLSQCGGRVG